VFVVAFVTDGGEMRDKVWAGGQMNEKRTEKGRRFLFSKQPYDASSAGTQSCARRVVVKPRRTHVSKRKEPTVNMKLHDKYDQLYLKLALTYIYSSNVPSHNPRTPRKANSTPPGRPVHPSEAPSQIQLVPGKRQPVSTILPCRRRGRPAPRP